MAILAMHEHGQDARGTFAEATTFMSRTLEVAGILTFCDLTFDFHLPHLFPNGLPRCKLLY